MRRCCLFIISLMVSIMNGYCQSNSDITLVDSSEFYRNHEMSLSLEKTWDASPENRTHTIRIKRKGKNALMVETAHEYGQWNLLSKKSTTKKQRKKMRNEVVFNDSYLEDSFYVHEFLGTFAEWFFVRQYDYHSQTIYMVSTSTLNVDTIIGMPHFFKDYILCWSWECVDGGKRQEVEILKYEDNGLKVVFKKEAFDMGFYTIDECYIKENELYIKGESMPLNGIRQTIYGKTLFSTF